jgi:type II secretory pathway pseudopilin PulG
MEILVAVVVIGVVGAVIWFVGAPLRSGAAAVDAAERDLQARRDALDAAKEAKYREIRETELDFRTGKLSEDEWTSQDRSLRAEAVEILKQRDELG